MWITTIGVPFFLSIIAMTGVTPWVIRFAKYFQLVDDTKKRHHPAHTHTGIIPRAGGLAIFLVISIISFFYLPLNKLFIGIGISCLILTVIGLLDDKKDISPYIRIFTTALAVGIVII